MLTNPVLNLELSEVSAAEALEALSRASGIGLRAPDPKHIARMPEVAERLRSRCSFDWRSATFAVALRELHRVYGLLPSARIDGTYEMLPGRTESTSEGATAVADFCQDGFRIYPTVLNRTLEAGFRFEREGDRSRAVATPGYRNSLFVGLQCECETEDPGRLTSIANWRAEDDTGKDIQSLAERTDVNLPPLEGSSGTYPDEWSAHTVLSLPSPGAACLKTLSGELMHFAEYRADMVELPVAALQAGYRHRVFGEVEIEIVSFEIEPIRDAFMGDLDEDRSGYVLRTLIRKPAGVYVSTVGEVREIRPRLVDAAENPFLYAPRLSDDRHLNREHEEQLKVVTRFQPHASTPERIQFDLAVKSRIEPRLTFRMRDVPLPHG